MLFQKIIQKTVLFHKIIQKTALFCKICEVLRETYTNALITNNLDCNFSETDLSITFPYLNTQFRIQFDSHGKSSYDNLKSRIETISDMNIIRINYDSGRPHYIGQFSKNEITGEGTEFFDQELTLKRCFYRCHFGQ